MISMIQLATRASRLGLGRSLGSLAAFAALLATGQSVLAGGIGDFDGNGRDDVLLRHEDGR